MLINEAKWLGSAIQELPIEPNSVFLNFGSQTENYHKENKHIVNYLINPILKNHLIKNLDLHPGKGIDFVGNIYDDNFLYEMKQIKFDIILLCNVLEHVEDIERLCQRIEVLLAENGYLVFSGPNDYPTHYDPIDNGFRPEISEVQNLFKNLNFIKGEIIKDFTYSFYMLRSPKLLITTLMRSLMPFYKYNKWKSVVLPKFLYWNKQFKVTCVIFQKKHK